MKFGIRKPSVKKRLKARTTGRVKRTLKKSINPVYGKKGAGWVNNPKKAAYNKVYNKTTISADNLIKGSGKRHKTHNNSKDIHDSNFGCGCLTVIVILLLFSYKEYALPIAILGLIIWFFINRKKKNNIVSTPPNKKRVTSKELDILKKQGERYIEIYNDCQRLFQETSNPDVFFMRYDLAIEKLNQLKEIIESYEGITYEGTNVDLMLDTLDAERNNQTFEFVTRYFIASKHKACKLKTDIGRLNNLAKSKEKLMEYEEYLDKDSLELAEILWEGGKEDVISY